MIDIATRKRITKLVPFTAVLSRTACMRVGHELVGVDARVVGYPDIVGNFVTIFSKGGRIAVYELPCTG